MPASARNSVDFPEPERPVMTTEWPRSSTRSASASSFAPFGSSMVASRICTAPSGASASVRSGAERGARRDHRAVERGEPLDDGVPLRQIGIPGDEPRQRVLHPAERAGRLGQPAQRDLAGEEARCGDDEREHHRHLLVARGERVQHLGALHDRPPVADHAGEAMAEQRPSPRPRRSRARCLPCSRARAPGCSGNRPPRAAGGTAARPADGRPDG